MAMIAPSQDERYKAPAFRRVDDQVFEESDMLVKEFTVDGLTHPDPAQSAINIKAWLKTDPGQWLLEHCVEEP